MYETAYAIHNLFWQWRWHHGICVATPLRGDESSSSSQGRDATLPDADAAARAIVSDPRFTGSITSQEIRMWLKAKRIAASTVLSAVDKLGEHEVVDTEEVPGKGHRKLRVTKRSWSSISSSETALTYIKKLRVTRDVFDP